MRDTPLQSDQLPEEAPPEQVPDDGAGDREAARRAPPEQAGDQGESRGADADDETAQTGNPDKGG